MTKAEHIVGVMLEVFDPDAPRDPKKELGRMIPSKEYSFGGNAMLDAASVILKAQRMWMAGDKVRADQIMHSWEGAPEEVYQAILSGNCRIKRDGWHAKVTVYL